jgi:subtilisin family serine protease
MRERKAQLLLRLAAAITPLLAAAVLGVPAGLTSATQEARTNAVITYRSPAALRAALKRYPARVIKRLPDVRSVEVRPEYPAAFAAGVSKLPGILSVDVPERRFSAADPGLTAMYSAGVPYQWQYTATRVGSVPETVLRAAASVTIAVIDTGADLTAPDLAAKQPATYNIFNNGTDVRDLHGH